MKKRHLAGSLFLVGLFIVCVEGSIPSGRLKKDILNHSIQNRSEDGENPVTKAPQKTTSKVDKPNKKADGEDLVTKAPQKTTSKVDKPNKKEDGEDLVTKAPQKTTSKVDKPDKKEDGENVVTKAPQKATSKVDKPNKKAEGANPVTKAPQMATTKGNKPNKKADVDVCKEKKIQQICKRQGKTCVNTLGSYKCDCGRGFYSDRKTCKDKDECKAGIHNCSRIIYCQNTRGSFKCVCPRGYDRVIALSVVDCVATDLTRWTTFKYFLNDLKAGVLTRIAAVGAAGLIVLLLLILFLVCLVRRSRRKAKEKELKRLAYTEQLMIAAGLVDPNEMFYPDQGGYGQGGGMYYPPEAMGQPQGNMGQPMEDPMGNYAQDNMGYAEGMGHAFDKEPPSGPMPIEGEFVPHTYYADDQAGSEDEGY